jgi:hypothetical protein
MFEQEELIEQLGSSYTRKVVERFHRFAFVPLHIIDQLAGDALHEEWGQNNFVLKKYLAVHVPWSIEQGRYTHGESQFYVMAGHLQTRYGTPLYLVFGPNHGAGPEPWRLIAAGSHISAPQLPS